MSLFVPVHSGAYVSDLHYSQEATESGSASSLVTNAHRWNLGKGATGRRNSRGSEVQEGKQQERTTRSNALEKSKRVSS